MPKIHANGLNFHYQQAGEGPDVVLIHGVTGDLSIWFLCQAMGMLGRSFRVTAYDLRGHGYSDVPPSGYTSADQAGDTLAIMDALEIDQAMLLGHSFGGVIAMHAAVLHPDRIEAVVLSDPCFAALRHLEDLGRWGHWQNFREEAAQAGVTLSSETLVRPCQVLRPGPPPRRRAAPAVPPGRRACPASIACCAWPTTTCGEDAKAVAGLTEDLIRGVTQPVLALFGEFSPFLATADYLAGTCPTASAVRVPGRQASAPEENSEQFVEMVYRVPADGPAIGRGREAGPMTTQPSVLLTGAAHGIGRATALALARRGTPMGLIDRDGPALATLAQELQEMGSPVAEAVADVTDREAMPAGGRGHYERGSDRSRSSSPAPGSAP